MTADDALFSRLVEALERTRSGAATKPVSVTLPAPLAEAFRLLADEGMIDSVSVAASRALEDVLQAVVIGMRVNQISDRDPQATPTQAEVAALERQIESATVGRELESGS
ncbi:hypothetical protein [Euzebya tangerina]|uniref:hypothetical protein n=1 Tax=Euzebya tangerina TaxID=591198 RepID=UPI000E31EFA1|nr:hypothetical protein [Euzebya tangerina]